MDKINAAFLLHFPNQSVLNVGLFWGGYRFAKTLPLPFERTKSIIWRLKDNIVIFDHPHALWIRMAVRICH